MFHPKVRGRQRVLQSCRRRRFLLAVEHCPPGMHSIHKKENVRYSLELKFLDLRLTRAGSRSWCFWGEVCGAGGRIQSGCHFALWLCFHRRRPLEEDGSLTPGADQGRLPKGCLPLSHCRRGGRRVLQSHLGPRRTRTVRQGTYVQSVLVVIFTGHLMSAYSRCHSAVCTSQMRGCPRLSTSFGQSFEIGGILGEFNSPKRDLVIMPFILAGVLCFAGWAPME